MWASPIPGTNDQKGKAKKRSRPKLGGSIFPSVDPWAERSGLSPIFHQQARFRGIEKCPIPGTNDQKRESKKKSIGKLGGSGKVRSLGRTIKIKRGKKKSLGKVRGIFYLVPIWSFFFETQIHTYRCHSGHTCFWISRYLFVWIVIRKTPCRTLYLSNAWDSGNGGSHVVTFQDLAPRGFQFSENENQHMQR